MWARVLLPLCCAMLLANTLAEQADGTRSTQFLESLEACPTYRGPRAWQTFLQRIGKSVSTVDLVKHVSPDAENVAVLIEPRRDPCIGLVVREIFHYLRRQSDTTRPVLPWRLHIFHGPDNLEFVKNELAYRPLLASHETCSAKQNETCTADVRDELDVLDFVTFTDLSSIVKGMDVAARAMRSRLSELEAAAGGPPHLTFDDKKPPPASPAERWPAFLLRKWDEHRELMDAEIAGTGFWNLNRFVYSQVLLDEVFWNEVPAENVLIFQTDAVLCRGGIQDYMEYDYVGAPWYLCDSMFGGEKGQAYLCEAGNGGLSLRKKSVMLRQIRNQLRSLVMEDYQIANWFFKNPGSGHLPSFAEARDIFVETIDTTTKDVVPLGTHKPWATNYNIRLREFLGRCAQDL